MKKLLIIFTVLLAAGCGMIDHKEQAAVPERDGMLKDGLRIVELADGFTSIRVYRGETVRLVLRGDGALSLSAPDFDAVAEDNGEVFIEIKATQTGSYAINATINDESLTGKLIVDSYAQEGVYHSLNAAGFEAEMTGDYLLLDVRTPEEYDAGHIEGALLIPHTELSDRLDELTGYDKILVYCASGNRSVAASQILVDAGFAQVYELAAGYSSWRVYKNP